MEGMLRIVVNNAQVRCPQHAHEAWACAGLVSWSSRLVSIGITCGDAKIVPVVEAAGHAGQRCARVLVLRPLDPPRARPWRLHRRRRRRRVAIWRSRAGGWTVPRRRRLYTNVYHSRLGVKVAGATLAGAMAGVHCVRWQPSGGLRAAGIARTYDYVTFSIFRCVRTALASAASPGSLRTTFRRRCCQR